MSEQNSQPNQQHASNNKAPFVIGATATLASLGLLAYQAVKPQSTPQTETEPTPSSVTQPVVEPVVTTTQTGKTYTAVGEYTSPAGEEEIGVTITIDSGIIKDAGVEVKATNQFSKKWQGVFQSSFKQLVIGKDIATLKLDAVSGSSLTPKGFNDAVEKIKAQLPS